MISHTRLNGSPLWLNADLVEVMEPTPDTVVSLLDGRRIIVRESCEQVRQKVIDYRSAVLRAGLVSGACGCSLVVEESRLGLHHTVGQLGGAHEHEELHPYEGGTS